MGNEPDALELYGPGEIARRPRVLRLRRQVHARPVRVDDQRRGHARRAGRHPQARPRRLSRDGLRGLRAGRLPARGRPSSSCPRSTRSRGSRRSACSRRCPAAGGYDFAAVCSRVVDLALERAAGPRPAPARPPPTCRADDARRRGAAARRGTAPRAAARRTPRPSGAARPASRRPAPARCSRCSSRRRALRRDQLGRLRHAPHDGHRRDLDVRGRGRSRRSPSPTARTCSRSAPATWRRGSRCIPAIRGASITVALPDEVRVDVAERVALLAWEVGGERYLVDEDGLLFARDRRRRRPRLRASCPSSTTSASRPGR